MDFERLFLKREKFRVNIRRGKIDIIVRERRQRILAESSSRELRLPEPDGTLPNELVGLIRTIGQELSMEAEVGSGLPAGILQQAMDYCVQCLVKVGNGDSKMEHDTPSRNPTGQLTHAISMLSLCSAFNDIKLPETLLSLYTSLLGSSSSMDVLRDLITFFAQCCELKHFALIRSEMVLDQVLHQLKRWNTDSILDEMMPCLLGFINSYSQHTSTMPSLLLQHECKMVLRLCFHVLIERYYEYLYERNQKRTIEVAVSILLHLIDHEYCSAASIEYPLQKVVEILQHEGFSGICKSEALLLLGQAGGQSDHVAVKLIKELDLLKVVASCSHNRQLDRVFLHIASRLTLVPELLPSLSDLADSLLIRYRMEEEQSKRVLLLQFLLNYLSEVVSHHHKQILPNELRMLEVLASDDQQTLLNEEIGFWREMVKWGYRGRLPHYILQNAQFLDDPLVAAAIQSRQ